MPIHTQFYQPAIWTRKVDQGDVRLWFASGSVRATLVVYVYSG